MASLDPGMPALFQTSRRVEFRDTDAAGIMHFGAILGLMEEAEHEFLRHLGLPLFREVPGGTLSWPRVSVSSDFLGPARFEEVLDIEVGVARLGRRSVTYQFFLRGPRGNVAKGTMTSACCFFANGTMEGRDIPEDVRQSLAPYEVSTDTNGASDGTS